VVNSEELIGTIEYVTLYKRCHINRCCHNRTKQYLNVFIIDIYRIVDNIGNEYSLRTHASSVLGTLCLYTYTCE
jgi:hypothetical protein